MTAPRSVLDILTDEGRWVKGVAATNQGWCLAVAVVKAGRTAHELRAVEDAILVLFPERFNATAACPIIGFNDHPETTFEDVVRVVKVAGV